MRVRGLGLGKSGYLENAMASTRREGSARVQIGVFIRDVALDAAQADGQDAESGRWWSSCHRHLGATSVGQPHQRCPDVDGAFLHEVKHEKVHQQWSKVGCVCVTLGRGRQFVMFVRRGCRVEGAVCQWPRRNESAAQQASGLSTKHSCAAHPPAMHA